MRILTRRFQPLLLLLASPLLLAQTATPLAIVPLDNSNADSAASVTGALEILHGKALIAVSGTVSSGTATTEVVLPHRGILRVCASTSVNLAADSSVPAGEIPGLMMALDHGAVEASFATGRNADLLLTPDFRILISGPGAAEVKVRLGQRGDTCVDNGWVAGNSAAPSGGKAKTDAPYVLVTSVFDGGAYRVQAGQRVMFQHGSLQEVVDEEKEPCGCPPAAPRGNEFPLAQSEGLAPLPKTTAPAGAANPVAIAPLVYTSAARASVPAADASADTNANPAAKAQAAPPRRGVLAKIGRFFRRIFGAE